jgi:hypothetical protein
MQHREASLVDIMSHVFCDSKELLFRGKLSQVELVEGRNFFCYL